MPHMIAVRNVDEDAYRRLKAQAALEGRTVGETLSDAIEEYLRGRPAKKDR